MKRAGFSGSRRMPTRAHRRRLFDLIKRAAFWADEIVVGDADGFDRFVRKVVGILRTVFKVACAKLRVFFAEWDRFGRAAGPRRNGKMVVCLADADERFLIAAPGPRSRGTWDCARQAKRAGIGVRVERVEVERWG